MFKTTFETKMYGIMETTINLNDRVKVTLTAKGAQIITEYYADMHKDYPLIAAKKFKEGDVLEEQLYYIMYMYGSSMYAGAENVFVDNQITLTIKDTKDEEPVEEIKVEDIDESELSIEDSEKELIRKALTKANGNRKEAAAILGLSERTIYRKMKEYDL